MPPVKNQGGKRIRVCSVCLDLSWKALVTNSQKHQDSPPELAQHSTKKPKTNNNPVPNPGTNFAQGSADVTPADPIISQRDCLSSTGSGDATQAFTSTQVVDPNAPLSDEVQDEVKEGVWGYLLPLDMRYGKAIVLRKRTSCPDPQTPGNTPIVGSVRASARGQTPDVAASPRPSINQSGGYLIGRHPECDVVIASKDRKISNRHCLIFTQNTGHDTIAILEDISSNGTFINEAIVGQNQRRELQDHDEIDILDKARFIFRYPKSRVASAFSQQYTLVSRLGKGHFATVFLCVEKSSGQHYAVKIFDKPAGADGKKKTQDLQQEIAVLMGVNHLNVLCLKDTFNESNHVYIVLELAPEGDLFNYIVKSSNITENDTRKLFKQLFEGVKYLVCGIVTTIVQQLANLSPA